MTTEEAETVCEIMATADGACVYCVKDLAKQFLHRFPEFPAEQVAKWCGIPTKHLKDE